MAEIIPFPEGEELVARKEKIRARREKASYTSSQEKSSPEFVDGEIGTEELLLALKRVSALIKSLASPFTAEELLKQALARWLEDLSRKYLPGDTKKRWKIDRDLALLLELKAFSLAHISPFFVDYPLPSWWYKRYFPENMIFFLNNASLKDVWGREQILRIQRIRKMQEQEAFFVMTEDYLLENKKLSLENKLSLHAIWNITKIAVGSFPIICVDDLKEADLVRNFSAGLFVVGIIPNPDYATPEQISSIIKKRLERVLEGTKEMDIFEILLDFWRENGFFELLLENVMINYFKKSNSFIPYKDYLLEALVFFAIALRDLEVPLEVKKRQHKTFQQLISIFSRLFVGSMGKSLSPREAAEGMYQVLEEYFNADTVEIKS